MACLKVADEMQVHSLEANFHETTHFSHECFSLNISLILQKSQTLSESCMHLLTTNMKPAKLASLHQFLNKLGHSKAREYATRVQPHNIFSTTPFEIIHQLRAVVITRDSNLQSSIQAQKAYRFVSVGIHFVLKLPVE